MLTQAQVQRYAMESGLRDIMIAEKELVLTFLLQLLSERGLLDRMAFKGGTCLRKMFIGSQGRFSTNLDFTGIEEHHHEDVILEIMGAFQEPYHGIQFSIPDNAYYETEDTLSWGVNPVYAHESNPNGDGEVKLLNQPTGDANSTDCQAATTRAKLLSAFAVCTHTNQVSGFRGDYR